MNRLTLLVFLLSATSACALGLNPDDLPRTPPLPTKIAPEALEKYRTDMQEHEKHSRAHQCVDLLRAKGLEISMDNIKANCQMHRRRAPAP